jgi:hypothetical protein
VRGGLDARERKGDRRKTVACDQSLILCINIIISSGTTDIG